MERGKGTSGRGGKSKTPLFPADLYALGSKSSSEAKPRASSSLVPKAVPTLTNVPEREKKREGGPIPPAVPSKKIKVAPSFVGRPILPSPSTSSSPPTSSDSWEASAIEIDPSELVSHVLEALEADDIDKVIGNVCGAVKVLRSQRFKPDVVLFQSLAYLAKVKPVIFTFESVLNAVTSLLKRDNSFAFKAKGNSVTPALAVNVLMTAYLDIKKWPDIFIKIYLEDAQGERAWVDNEYNKQFVDNIVASLSTKKIPLSVCDVVPHEEEPTPSKPSLHPPPPPPIPRFRWNREIVENIVLENVKDQLTRKQGVETVNRQFIKMLTSLCGLQEVRLLAASKLEVWLQNPKLMRSAQELLMSICVNCTSHTIRDVDVISVLIKMRLKTKALGNYYLACIKELITANPDNLGTVLKHTIYNELSTPRNPNNNMAMLSVIFQMDPDKSTAYLANIFLELVYNREDYLRSLRTLLREMARVLRGELRLVVFCQGLFSRDSPLPRDADPVRSFASVADLVTLAIFLTVMPHARSDKKDIQQIERMQAAITQIQSDAMNWLLNSALPIYRPPGPDYVHILHKILLLETPEQYTKVDNWPEQDKMLFLRLATEVPVNESTLITLMALGVSKDYPLTPQEALEFTEQLVKRAAAVNNPLHPLLNVEKMKVVDLVMNACAYRHPENIDLPSGYTPPALAITQHYWKAWTILLVLAAHNPNRLGALAWEKYPTLRILMEMCITGHFAFPPGFDDLQMLALEKQRILEFESHLAAASTKMEITEATSLLLPQLMSMEPLGPGRRPPHATLDYIKSLNNTLRLGHLLCRSRDPDFLLDIIQRQGPSQSMPWLADLVHSSEGSLNHLPVQCLCEFLMSCSPKQESKYQELLAHLQNIVNSPEEDPAAACEVLDYFLRRLSSSNNRSLAISGLKLILNFPADDSIMDLDRSLEDKGDTFWLSNQLPTIPHFKIACQQIATSLRSACQVENDPTLVTAYLTFMADHIVKDTSSLADLVLDMATLIVERSTIMSAIMPSSEGESNAALEALLYIFFFYVLKIKGPPKGEYTWCQSQDHVLVTWPWGGDECTIHILVVHALVILLTYGPSPGSKRYMEFTSLLELWFPNDLAATPKGFLVDTSEEALLIPDWLKLRMIRSHVPRLVEAALTDLDISQLILFIQSFGIPIKSMSKLLTALDEAVLTQKEAVSEAVLDKQYMGLLVEVQHRRGAIGGDTFIKVLELDAEKQNLPSPDPPFSHAIGKLRVTPREKQELLSHDQAIIALETIFWGQSSDRDVELFRAFQLTLVNEIRLGKVGLLKYILFNLVTKLTSFKMNSTPFCICSAILTKLQFSCPLFRLITAHNPDPPTLVVIAKTILSFAQEFPASKPLVVILQQYLKKMDMLYQVKEKKSIIVSVDSLNEAMERLLVTPSPLSGHLVDKLVKLEPEILGASTELQMRMLFSLEDRERLHCRPYLLTLLTHHASWKTLHQCTDMLLREDVFQKYDPTSVLDFLQALVCNPKLWQGREKHTPKHYTPENVLNLTSEQLKCVTDYIVSEGILSEGVKGDQVSCSTRLGLLCDCIVATDLSLAAKLASHLANRTLNSSGAERLMCNKLLVHLYLKIPSLICKLSNEEIKIINEQSSVSVSGSSSMDILSHRLITALASTPNTKDWSRKSQDLELAVRKMASTHPLLTLRQLSLVASSLFGRVDLDWSVFKSRGHLLFFQQVSSLLHLLQPHLFNQYYSESLHKILNVFLELFQNYGCELGAQGPLHILLNQFTQLMQNYIKLKPHISQQYLQTKAALIRDLQLDFPVLLCFCTVVSVPGGKLEVHITPSNTNEQPPPQWESKLSLITTNQDVVGGLSFLESATSKRPNLLEPVIGTLTELLSSSSSQVRTHAYTLVSRYLKHDPSIAHDIFPMYISLLESQHPDVVASSLQKLPEFVVLSQDLALKLLKKLFTLGTSYNVNTGECITKIINLLNLQSGC